MDVRYPFVVILRHATCSGGYVHALNGFFVVTTDRTTLLFSAAGRLYSGGVYPIHYHVVSVPSSVLQQALCMMAALMGVPTFVGFYALTDFCRSGVD